MGKIKQNMHRQPNAASGYYSAEVTTTFLPRCNGCGGSHPLARRGYRGDPKICPDCGVSVGRPGPALIADAKFTGSLWAIVANACLQFGAWLMGLAKRI